MAVRGKEGGGGEEEGGSVHLVNGRFIGHSDSVFSQAKAWGAWEAG